MPTIWDHINEICQKTGKVPYDEKSFGSFFVTLHFSLDTETLKYSEKILPFIFTIPQKAVYDYFYAVIPKRRRYIKWPKKMKEETSKEIEELQKECKISRQEALLFKEVLDGL